MNNGDGDVVLVLSLILCLAVLGVILAFVCHSPWFLLMAFPLAVLFVAFLLWRA